MRGKLRLEDARDQGGKEETHRPPAGTEVKIAIDLSRTKWVYCVRWGGEERRKLTTPADLSHVEALVGRYEGCRVHITFEACGFGYEIAWWAQERKIEVTVIAPSRQERVPGLRVKTDRLDARKMAYKLEQGDLKGIYIPPRAQHEKRQVARTYGQALKERTRAQRRIRSLMQEQGRLGPLPGRGWSHYRQWLDTQLLAEEVKLCVDTLLAMRTFAELQTRTLKARLLRIAGTEEYRKIVDALCTHPGVGQLSAIRFVLEIGDIHRFVTADSIGHYMGVTPSEYSSGDMVQRGPTLKCGPGSLRGTMVQCAWASVRKGGDAKLKEMFDRLAPKVGRKRAIVAVTRRMVVRLRARWLEALEEATSAA